MSQELITPGTFREAWDQYRTYAPDWDDFPWVHRKRERALKGRFAEEAGFGIDELENDEVVAAALNDARARFFHWSLKARITQRGNNPAYQQGLSQRRVGVSNAMRRRRDGRVPNQHTLPDELQQVVVESWDRVDYNPGDLRTGTDQFEAIMGMIVDPRRITPTLLRNMGLEDEIAPKGTSPEEKLRHYADIGRLRRIKRRLFELKPLTLPSEGLYDPEANTSLRLMQYNGELFVTQSNGESHFKRLARIELTGALRRAEHIRQGYRVEREILTAIQSKLREVYGKIPRSWTAALAEDAEATMDQVRTLSGKLEDQLKPLRHVTNQHKRKLATQIQASIGFEDSLGRLNPNAIRARLVKAGKLVGARLEDIAGIQPFVEEDRARLEQIHVTHEQPIQGFVEQVETWGEQLRILQLNRPLQVTERRHIHGNLLQLQEVIEGTLNFEPYRSFSRVVSAYIEQITAGLEQMAEPQQGLTFHAAPIRQRMATDFMTLFTIAKLKRAHAQFNDLYEKISLHPDEQHPEDLHRALNDIVAGLKRSISASVIASDPTQADTARASGDIAPEITTPDTYEAYVAVYELVEDLQRQLCVLMGNESDDVGTWAQTAPTPPLDDRQNTYKTMKGILRDFSFRELLEGIDEARAA